MKKKINHPATGAFTLHSYSHIYYFFNDTYKTTLTLFIDIGFY